MAPRSFWDELLGGTFSPTGYDYGQPPQLPVPQQPAPFFPSPPTDASGVPGHMGLDFLNAPMGRVIDYTKKQPYPVGAPGASSDAQNKSLYDYLFGSPTLDIAPGSFPAAVVGRSGRVIGQDTPSAAASDLPPPDPGRNYTPIPRSSAPAPYTPYAGNYTLPGLQPLSPEIRVADRPVAGAPAAAGDTTGAAALPATAQPAQGQGLPQQRLPSPAGPFSGEQDPSAFDRLSAFTHNLFAGQGLFPGIIDAIHGAATGARVDPQGMQLQMMNNTYQALRGRGYPHEVAMMAAMNPTVLNDIIAPKYGVVSEGPYGKRYGYPPPPPFFGGAGAVGGGAGYAGGGGEGTGGVAPPPEALGKGVRYNDDLKGDAWLAQFNPELQGYVKAWLGGSAMPSARSGQAQASLTSYAKNLAQRYSMDTTGQPLSDTDFTEKRKMATEFGSHAANTLGGSIDNGGSAMGHLAETSDALVGVNNYNGPNVPGGTWLGELGNVAKNVIGRTPERDYALAKARGWLQRFGQEGTKFYAGTGGGEGERTAALREQNPDTATAAHMAGFLEQERNAMVERFRSIEQHVVRSLGQDALAKRPVFTPELNAHIARIDANIARLRGQSPGAAAPAVQGNAPEGLPPPPPGFSVRVQ